MDKQRGKRLCPLFFRYRWSEPVRNLLQHRNYGMEAYGGGSGRVAVIKIAEASCLGAACGQARCHAIGGSASGMA